MSTEDAKRGRSGYYAGYREGWLNARTESILDAERARQADPVGLRPAVVAYLDHMDKREPYANVAADIAQAGSGGPDFTTDRHFDGDGCFAEMERAASLPAQAVEPMACCGGTNEHTTDCRDVFDQLDREAQAAEPGPLDVATVVAMENEGVVTWGDDGHRARFLSPDKQPNP